MAKKTTRLLTLAVYLLSAAGPLISGGGFLGQPQKWKLEELLQKAGNYCNRLNRISLFFVCLEDVEEEIYFPYQLHGNAAKTEVRHLVYDYQLIRKEAIEEKRILVSENGKQVNEADALLKTKSFEYKNFVFGPVGLFSLSVQDQFDYTIEKTTRLWGKTAVIVQAVPKNDKENKRRLFGKAWIDPDDGSVMKIEWEETSIGNYQKILDFAKKIGAKPQLKFTTEYQFEKNGIRFPNLTTVSENYTNFLELMRKSLLTVKCRDYKFFTVETEIVQK